MYAYPSRRRPRPRRDAVPPTAPGPPKRSHAAAYAALVVLVLGIYLGHYTILVPAGLGISLLFTAGSFLSARLNPLSIGFYLTTKPSWSAILLVFLSALALLGAAYYEFVHGLAPIVPSLNASGP
ncbi:MAG: hypothetical protein ACREDK_00230 [Thermoplasmata archaeon]